jgi:hypothetical protein
LITKFRHELQKCGAQLINAAAALLKRGLHRAKPPTFSRYTPRQSVHREITRHTMNDDR